MSKGMTQGKGLEDATPNLEKNPQTKFLIPLDKPLALWYNKRAEGRCEQLASKPEPHRKNSQKIF